MASFCCIAVISGSFAYLILFLKQATSKTDKSQECADVSISRRSLISALLPGITELSLPDFPTIRWASSFL